MPHHITHVAPERLVQHAKKFLLDSRFGGRPGPHADTAPGSTCNFFDPAIGRDPQLPRVEEVMAPEAPAPTHHEGDQPSTREKKQVTTDHLNDTVEEIVTEIDEHITGRVDGHEVDIEIVETVIVDETKDPHAHPRPKKTYVIQVNTQNVRMPQHKATGAEIKAAAIAQGVAIEPGFVLSVKHGDRYDIVGDDDVTLHKGLDFIATAPDDNS